jgi:hypothetical protein
VAAALPSVALADCNSDLDCSLNGLCTNSLCVCDPGWTTIPELAAGGPECGMLDLAPARSYESFHGLSEGTSSWGGSVLPIPDGKGNKYAMFAAEMTHNCTLAHWQTNSEVVLAVATDPTGPYTEQFQIIPPWSHNPEAILTPDGNIVIFTLGDGYPVHGPEYPCDKQTGDESAAADADVAAAPMPRRRRLVANAPRAKLSSSSSSSSSAPAPSPTVTANFTLHYAPAASFASKDSWQALNVSILDFPAEFEWEGNWNPAPVQMADGRVRVMVHTGWSAMTGK